MALDKLVDSTQLDADLTTVADAIRTKGGTSAQLSFPDGMAEAIAAISGGEKPWRLITHQTISQDAVRWKINLDDNGNPFSLTEFYAFFHILPNNNDYSGWVFFAPYYADWANDALICYSLTSSKDQNVRYIYEVGGRIAAGYFFVTHHDGSINGVTDRDMRSLTEKHRKYNEGKPVSMDSITGFSMNGYATGGVSAGTEIWVWGRDS